MKVLNFLLLSFISLISFNSCKPNQKQKTDTIPISQELTESAKFIAAMPLSKSSKLFPVTQTKEYQAYQKMMNIAWKKYNKDNLDPIKKWRDSELKEISETNLFYPFSGPDILNAVTFFPSAKDIIMLGLEPLGDIPHPIQKTVQQNIKELYNLRGVLPVLMGRNYFITSYMKKRIGSSSYNGIIGVMMFFLAKSNYDIISVKKVSLNQKAQIVPLEEALAKNKKPLIGVEIKFISSSLKKKTSENIKTAYYFRGDVSDQFLNDNLYNFIMKRKQFVTFLKASSYLLFYLGFDDIRSIILSRSKYIIQGSSGIPYHYFKNKNWDVNLYGTYIKTIKDFEYLCQPDLAKDIKTLSKGTLPFSYDYHFRKGKSFLLYAKRKTALSKPTRDKKNTIGQSSICVNNKLSIRNKKK